MFFHWLSKLTVWIIAVLILLPYCVSLVNKGDGSIRNNKILFDTANPMIPTATELLNHLNTLDYHDRQRYVIKLSQANEENPDLANLVDDLWQYGEPTVMDDVVKDKDDVEDVDESERLYSSSLSLTIASYATNIPNREQTLMKGLKSGSLSLGLKSSTALGRDADADTIKKLLPDLPRKFRRRILSSIISSKRTETADELVPFFCSKLHDHDMAARLLRVCSSNVVKANLPDLRYAVGGWKKLARSHPDVVLNDLQERLQVEVFSSGSSAGRLERIASQLGSAFTVLAVECPQEIVDVAIKCLDSGYSIPRGIQNRLGTLAKRAPEEVGDILVHPAYRERLFGWNGLPRGLLSKIRLLPKMKINELLRIVMTECGSSHQSDSMMAPLLKQFPPSERGELFEHARDNIDISGRKWGAVLLDVLPHNIRNSEATRICSLSSVRGDPSSLLMYKSYCDIVDTRTVLEIAANRPLAEERARGFSFLIACSGRYRQGISETLAFAARSAKDQDLVRQSILTSIVNLPPSLLTSDKYHFVKELIHASFSSRDLSLCTYDTIVGLAHRLLTRNGNDAASDAFQFGLDILQESVSLLKNLRLPRFKTRQLSQKGADMIYFAVEPTLQKVGTKTKYNFAVELAESLDKRAREISGIQDLLQQASLDCKDKLVADRAVRNWLSDPKTRDERVRYLVDRDLSVIGFFSVGSYLIKRRQTWLNPYLDDSNQPIKSRFDNVALAFPIESGFKFLAPNQQEKYRKYLCLCADDPSDHITWRKQAIELLSNQLPGVTIDTLKPYLNTSFLDLAEDRILFEKALARLVWTDRPSDAVSLLTDFLDGDLAHIAMYAIQRCANLMPPNEVLEALQEVLSREKLKITVHKECLRLLGGLGTYSGSISVLFDLWNAEGANYHRDVKIAFCHAARQQLQSEKAWDILDGIVNDKDAFVVRSVLEMDAASCPGEAARRRYGEVLLSLVGHPNSNLRCYVFRTLSNWIDFGLEEDIADASIVATSDLDDTVVWKGALSALVAAIRSRKIDNHLLKFVRYLRTSEVLPEYNACREGNDLPGRCRIAELCNRLQGFDKGDRTRLKNLFSNVAAEIQKDETLWNLASQLKLSSMDWTDTNSVVHEFKKLAISADDVPSVRIEQLTRSINSALQRDDSSWKPMDAEAWLDCLYDMNDSKGSALAHVRLALVTAAVRRTSWVSPWVEYLRTLRENPDVGVRAAALGVHVGLS